MNTNPTHPNTLPQPTAEDLAGIPVLVEAGQTGPPRQRPVAVRTRGAEPAEPGQPTPDYLAGIPVPVEGRGE
ncbi:MAG: hypothetical protein L0Z62_40775 [Gemmataceae bacterium]|nr:hypothetical protein [Gemmataceae bacterium]